MRGEVQQDIGLLVVHPNESIIYVDAEKPNSGYMYLNWQQLFPERNGFEGIGLEAQLCESRISTSEGGVEAWKRIGAQAQCQIFQ